MNSTRAVAELTNHLGCKAEMKCVLHIGRLIYGFMIRQLKQHCYLYGIECQITELGGFFTKTVGLKLKGQSEELVPIVQWIDAIKSGTRWE